MHSLQIREAAPRTDEACVASLGALASPASPMRGQACPHGQPRAFGGSSNAGLRPGRARCPRFQERRRRNLAWVERWRRLGESSDTRPRSSPGPSLQAPGRGLMHLRRLAIHALPGIEPGFTFEPPHAGINIVVGPNAIGKSSLARALGYLLASRASDPPALSLEAELASGDARWQVSRNGNQIVWRRNGEIVPPPALPGADRIGLFRLSVEHLLDDDDANDKALAERLWRELHGNFDLSQPRIEITPRFARHEAGRLARAGNERRRVEREYAELQRREANLPDLERRIEMAVAARARRDHLRQALGLADAIDARKARESALQPFPPDMDRLRGDEIVRLEEQERKTRELRETLRDRRRDLEAATADLERTGLAQSTPPPEDMRAAEERLRWLGEKVHRTRQRPGRLDRGGRRGARCAEAARRSDHRTRQLPPRLGRSGRHGSRSQCTRQPRRRPAAAGRRRPPARRGGRGPADHRTGAPARAEGAARPGRGGARSSGGRAPAQRRRGVASVAGRERRRFRPASGVGGSPRGSSPGWPWPAPRSPSWPPGSRTRWPRSSVPSPPCCPSSC